MKLSHLREIFVQSWKLGGELGILTDICKGAPLYTIYTTGTEPFKGERPLYQTKVWDSPYDTKGIGPWLGAL